MEQAARQLARKILAGAEQRPVIALTVQNLSSLDAAQVAAARRGIESEFQQQGAQLASLPAATVEVRIVFSENLQGYLWVAEIRIRQTQQVVMMPVPRTAIEPARTPALTLNRQRIWQQPEPILDFGVVNFSGDSIPRLLVLGRGKLVVYQFRDSQWQLQQTLTLPQWSPWPQDPRGRLWVGQGGIFTAYLPGGSCQGKAVAPVEFACHPNQEPWILRAGESDGAQAVLVPGRNLFEGLTLTGPPRQINVRFFSAAVVGVRSGARWVVASLEGRTLFYEEPSSPPAVFFGWGSDLASIESDCDDRMRVLATRPGDWTETDAIQAFEILERQPVAASDSTEFLGPVLALWQTQDPRVANAVVRNLKTGQYEAYSLSISCRH